MQNNQFRDPNLNKKLISLPHLLLAFQLLLVLPLHGFEHPRAHARARAGISDTVVGALGRREVNVLIDLKCVPKCCLREIQMTHRAGFFNGFGDLRDVVPRPHHGLHGVEVMFLGRRLRRASTVHRAWARGAAAGLVGLHEPGKTLHFRIGPQPNLKFNFKHIITCFKRQNMKIISSKLKKS